MKHTLKFSKAEGCWRFVCKYVNECGTIITSVKYHDAYRRAERHAKCELMLEREELRRQRITMAHQARAQRMRKWRS